MTMPTSPRGRQVCLVVYDIADDDRREDLYMYLSGIGVRVQLSVFEVDLAGPERVVELRQHIAQLIDKEEDQVRIYPMTLQTISDRLIVGNRTLQERADFWLV